MKHDPLQDRPAIIIAAFGSSRRGKTLLANFDANVRSHFPSHEVFWGYTSRVIRKKTGNPSLHQALSMVESEGFRRVVVLPLQIFPGSEYRNPGKL